MQIAPLQIFILRQISSLVVVVADIDAFREITQTLEGQWRITTLVVLH